MMLSALGKPFAGIVVVRVPGYPDDVGPGDEVVVQAVEGEGEGGFVSDVHAGVAGVGRLPGLCRRGCCPRE